MTKTFDQSLIDTAVIPMSMIDPEDMADKNSEEFKSMRRVQSGCHIELTNREDFPFNQYIKKISLTKGQNTYSMPDGSISQVILTNGNDKSKLPYEPNFDLLEETTGYPDRFAVSYHPLKLKFYPTPDNTYTATIRYNSTKNVILEDGTYSYTVENNSTLRMPEQYQHLYFDALEYYVLATNMRKQSNPRWQPTYEIFRQKWNTFLRGSKSIDGETVFTI